jgi:hypothetical protein
MKRFLFENFWLKVLALVIACVLWAYVGWREFTTKKASLALQLTEIPEGMAVDDNVKSRVTVIFKGRKDILDSIDPDELMAVMSLKEVAPLPKDLIARPPIRVEPKPSGVVVTMPNIAVHLIPLKKKKKKE